MAIIAYNNEKVKLGSDLLLAAISECLKIDSFSRAVRYERVYLREGLLREGEFAEALRYSLKFKSDHFEKLNAQQRFDVNLNLTEVYFFLEKADENLLDIAQENYDLAITESLDFNRFRSAMFYLALGNSNMGNLEKAKKYYAELIDVMLKRNDNSVSSPMNNIAGIYRRTNQLDSAKYYLKEGIKYARLEGRLEGVAGSFLGLGKIRNLQEDFNRAQLNCDSALSILEENNILRRKRDCAICLSEAYKGLGEFKESLDFLEKSLEFGEEYMQDEERAKLQGVKKEFDFKIQHVKDSLGIAHQQEVNAQSENLRKLESESQHRRNTFFIIVTLLLLGFTVFAYNRYIKTRNQKRFIEDQKKEVDQAHQELEEKNTEILDSIKYAKRIQTAILPPDKMIERLLSNCFVLYKPKDVVAGDFYWFEEVNDQVLFAAADCTGHGVPGAMVSMICNNALNRSVKEFGLTEPGLILDRARSIVIEEFEKSEEEVKDGMDIALCSLSGSILKFAGAHNPLWIVREGAIIEIKGSKQPVGQVDKIIPFETHTIELKKKDKVYIFSDGFVDQFGGPKGKKFRPKAFRELLLSIEKVDIQLQSQKLEEAFENWRGEEEQLDDVCITGFEVN